MFKALLRCVLLLGLFALATKDVAAQAACPSQPANAEGTTIASPAPDQEVGTSFEVSGDYFGSFEGVVPIRVLDAYGTALFEGSAMNECCTLSPYATTVTVSVAAPTPACVVVYSESGEDGSLTPLVQVPVTIVPTPGSLPYTGAGAGVPVALACLLALAMAGAGLYLRRRPA